MIKLLEEDFADTTSEDGIRIYFDKRYDRRILLMNRFISGIHHWQIKNIIYSEEESSIYFMISYSDLLNFRRVSREEFLGWMEEYHPIDYEWLLWNMEVLEGRYYGEIPHDSS